jgi:thymidine kinase
MKQTTGRIEVITGPMFCGKSEELIRRLRRAKIARQCVASFKPAIDNRYDAGSISSHSLQTLEATLAADTGDLIAKLGDTPAEVIGIDEVQFFGDAIVQVVIDLAAAGKRVVLAGLDMDFRAVPFGPVPVLLAIADEIQKLSAVCMSCGLPAIYTQRLSHSEELVVVGAQGMYEARCRACFEP